jgi:hypothetical protein
VKDETQKLLSRMLKSAKESAESGVRTMGDKPSLDQHELRNAATMFRQAAKELDEISGALTALHYERKK